MQDFISFLLSVPFLFWNLLLLSYFHLGLWVFLCFRLRGTRACAISLSEIGYNLPSALVVLPLRELGRQEAVCLRSLLTQDYPNYQLQIILDPRGEIDQSLLNQLLAEYPSIPVEYSSLETPKELHNLNQFFHAAYAQVLSFIQKGFTSSPEVLAMVSPQLTLCSTWLRELVAPLALQGMTATTSYPWHRHPPRSRHPLAGLQELAQYAWNGIAAIQMICVSRILWNGSMAVRTAYLTDNLVLERWRNMGLTDVALGQLLHQDGQRIRFVGSLMDMRRSPLDPPHLSQEIRQRLGALRRHHRFWILLAAQGVFVSLTNLRFLWKLSTSAIAGDVWTLRWILSGYCIYLFALVLLILTAERFVVAAGSTPIARSSQGIVSTLGLVFIVPFTHLTHAFSAVRILFASQYLPQRWRRQPIVSNYPIDEVKSSPTG